MIGRSITLSATRPNTEPATTGTYSNDLPVTSKRKRMRMAHLSSIVHEHTTHVLDHLRNMAGSKDENEKAYDAAHALKHATDLHDHSSKLIETVHQGPNRTLTTNRMADRAKGSLTSAEKKGTAGPAGAIGA